MATKKVGGALIVGVLAFACSGCGEGSGSDEVSDPDDAPAEISFHPVLGEAQDGADPADSEIILTAPDGQLLRLGPPALTSEDIVGVTADGSETLGWFLTIEFNGAGQSRWQQLTSEAACFQLSDPQRRIAIVVDDKIMSFPEMNAGIPCDVGITGGITQITGAFDEAEARELAERLGLGR
jgi:SecD/SecF fusion protein